MSYLQKIKIENDDISIMEERLSASKKDRITFSEDRRVAIKTLETCTIQASPGSGKTTLLTCKLGILARKWQSRHQGICVISHTNVAKNEIRMNLKEDANILNQHPHFIGTIHSFIIQYLGTPGITSILKKRPTTIDDEIFANRSLKYVAKAGKLLAFIRTKYAKQNFNAKDVLSSIRYYFEGKELRVCLSLPGINTPLTFTKTTSDSYIQALEVKKLLSEEGVFCYSDAFEFAEMYLENNPSLLKTISRRFPIVFIDEAQDTSEAQWTLINKIFKDSKIQVIGDLNQQIYEESSTFTIPSIRTVYSIDSSQRFSSTISDMVKNLCIIQQNITGNNQIANLRHSLIIFNDETIDSVLPTFAELIEKHGLKGGLHKAVGLTGQEPAGKKTTIKSYFKSFKSQSEQKGYREFSNFESYLKFGYLEHCSTNRALVPLLRYLAWGLMRCYQFSDGDTYIQSKDMLACLKSLYIQREPKVITIIEHLKNKEAVSPNESFELYKIVLTALQLQTKYKQAPDFLKHSADWPGVDLSEGNFYISPSDIKIEISTIHGVKGETHNSTLLLDTDFHDSHVKPLLPALINGTRPKRAAIIDKKMRVAYVALSRPRNFAAIALRAGNITATEIHALKAGWDIVDLTQRGNKAASTSE